MKYAYELPDETVVWREFPMMGEIPQTVDVDGVKAKRSYRSEVKGGKPKKGYPITCYASGVNANQAQELRDEFKRVGVPTEVTINGDPVYLDSGHRKRALKARGFFDRAAFY